MHVWLMLWTAAPSPAVCTAQLAVGLVAGAMPMVVVATKAMHDALVHENAVLCEMHGSSSKSHRTPLIMFAAPLTTVELVLVLAWLLNPETATTSAVSISPIDGSYWHCMGTWMHPAGVVFMALNTVVGLEAMWWIVKARNMLSPSHEPRMLLFAVTNMVLMLAVLVALSSMSVPIVSRYLITSAVAFVTTTLASFGLLGSKVVAIHWHRPPSLRARTAADPTRAPETVSAAPPATRALADADLCVLERAGAITAAFVPVRVRSNGALAPWRLCEVEVATEYQYLTVAAVSGSAVASYYSLPYRAITTDGQRLAVTVTTKSSTVLEIQVRDPVNLSEWVQVLDVGPDWNLLASVVPRVRAAPSIRVPTVKDPSKPAQVPRKGVLKSASIRRNSGGLGKTRSLPEIAGRGD
ncbi:hypothetical protein GGF32_009392 [Allomyces javanicus]|nr:hypothetical protein GGF32_009392 [Allomyces javanicus]